MRTARVFAAVAAAVLGAVTLDAVAGKQVTFSPPSVFAGVVVDAGNNPVPCERVAVQEPGQMLSMRTGDDGRFRFSKVRLQVGRLRIGDGQGPITVMDVRRYDDPANVRIVRPRLARLAGVLLDEHHQPARNIEVTALARQPQYGRPRFVPVANDVTEADGSYCIQIPMDRANDDFVVGVIPAGTALGHPLWAEKLAGLPGHPPTYFPSVTSSGSARVLRLSNGRDRLDVNFAIQAGRVSRIEGVVTNADGLTLTASDVVLEPPDEDVALYRRMTPDPAGRFEFDDVPPGSYALRLFPSNRLGGGTRWGIEHVTVRGEPTVRVTLASQPTMTFAGLVGFAGHPSMLPGVPLDFTLYAARVPNPADRFPSGLYPSGSSNSDAEGRFTIKNLVPGEYQLSVYGASARGWRLASITVPTVNDDGIVERQNVTWTPFLVEAGRDTFGAEVALTSQPPAITGVVRDAAGRPIVSRVIVVPVVEQGVATVDVQSRSDGTFSIVDLRPGDYLVVAVRDAPADFMRDPAVLAGLRAAAVRLTVGPAPATAQVTLTQVVWPPRTVTRDAPRMSKR